MQSDTNRRFVFKITFSLFTAGGIYWRLISPFEFFSNEDYNDMAKLSEFIASDRLIYSVGLVLLTYFIFYVLLERILTGLLYSRVKSFFDNTFDEMTLPKKQVYLKRLIRGIKFGKKFSIPLKPKKGEDISDTLFTRLVMVIHFSVCVLLLELKFSTILIPFAILVFLIVSVVKPIFKHLVGLFEKGEIKIEQIE